MKYNSRVWGGKKGINWRNNSPGMLGQQMTNQGIDKCFQRRGRPKLVTAKLMYLPIHHNTVVDI